MTNDKSNAAKAIKTQKVYVTLESVTEFQRIYKAVEAYKISVKDSQSDVVKVGAYARFETLLQVVRVLGLPIE